MGGIEWSKQTLILAIQLLLEFLLNNAGEFRDIILLKTNVGAFARYVSKDSYPRGLGRLSYVQSVEIQRLLSRPEKAGDIEDGENRMMHPQAVKSLVHHVNKGWCMRPEIRFISLSKILC